MACGMLTRLALFAGLCNERMRQGDVFMAWAKYPSATAGFQH